MNIHTWVGVGWGRIYFVGENVTERGGVGKGLGCDFAEFILVKRM